MKSLFKKTGVVFIIFGLFLGVILFLDKKDDYFKDDVYVIFDYNKIKKQPYKYPRKLINSEDEKSTFKIVVNSGMSVNFINNSRKLIDYKKINQLNILSVDSILTLIPGVYFKPIHKKLIFNIIEINGDKSSIIKVTPSVVHYN
ncbi:hypothetical protein M4I21_18415 [Cellulophaga sp. 20_2_10]|nr:hypothetical protein [Cellulophaga sp. 20_2_10]